MTNRIFLWMLMLSCVFSLVRGEAALLGKEALLAAQNGVETVFSMCGGFAFFCGVMAILREAGAMGFLCRALRKPLKKLFGSGLRDEALESVTMNLVANMLGMGNAATPMGIRAVQEMAEGERASNAVCLFLVINISSVQLLPTTMLSLRAAAGSQMPDAVVIPSLIATAVSTLSGIVSCKMLEKWS